MRVHQAVPERMAHCTSFHNVRTSTKKCLTLLKKNKNEEKKIQNNFRFFTNRSCPLRSQSSRCSAGWPAWPCARRCAACLSRSGPGWPRGPGRRCRRPAGPTPTSPCENSCTYGAGRRSPPASASRLGVSLRGGKLPFQIKTKRHGPSAWLGPWRGLGVPASPPSGRCCTWWPESSCTPLSTTAPGRSQWRSKWTGSILSSCSHHSYSCPCLARRCRRPTRKLNPFHPDPASRRLLNGAIFLSTAVWEQTLKSRRQLKHIVFLNYV